MKLIKLILGLLLVLGCSTQKDKSKVVQDEKTQMESPNKVDFTNEGYIQATIIVDMDKKSLCKYLIQTTDKQLLEPGDELKSEYRSNDLSIWVKYHPQRRMSRCGNAQPIEIIGIEKR